MESPSHMLSIRQCLEIMHSGAIFSMKVVTYDRRRKSKSGRVIEIAEAKLVWGDGEAKKENKGERAPTALEKSLMASNVNRRDPNHSWHYTRNIRLYNDGAPTESMMKIHPPLIIEFNGQTTTP